MKYIVSFTSHSTRLAASAAKACTTMLEQTYKPDKIILWVGYQYRNKIPSDLQGLTKSGLEIRFCEDIGPGTKLIPALKEFPNDCIITLDDDQYYPKDTIERLVEGHKLHPDKIVCNNGRKIQINSSDEVVLSKFQRCSSHDRIWPWGFGGVLYPPGSLHPDVFNIERLRETSFTHDDVWFAVMGMLAQREVYWTGKPAAGPHTRIAPNNAAGGTALCFINTVENNSSAHCCFKKLFQRYPQAKEYLRSFTGNSINRERRGSF